MSAGGVAAKIAAITHNVLDASEYWTLRTLRDSFARKGNPPAAEGSPEHQARGASYTTLAELWRVLTRFRDRRKKGDAVRLVVVEQTSEPDRMRLEIRIEEDRA